MRETHLLMVAISWGLILVPARISSFRLPGSFINSLICSSSSALYRISVIIIPLRAPLRGALPRLPLSYHASRIITTPLIFLMRSEDCDCKSEPPLRSADPPACDARTRIQDRLSLINRRVLLNNEG
jgi:hypothetical protein